MRITYQKEPEREGRAHDLCLRLPGLPELHALTPPLRTLGGTMKSLECMKQSGELHVKSNKHQ